MAGGKRIIKTMGTKIIRITPHAGIRGGDQRPLTILAASHLGVPVSTTHCINACIMGVGASKRLSAVRWAWRATSSSRGLVTLPLAGALSFGAMLVLEPPSADQAAELSERDSAHEAPPARKPPQPKRTG